MNEKNRLIKALQGDAIDRPPVICPGGMMSACVTEVLAYVEGSHHTDPQVMAAAAKGIRDLTGFENYGVPFCLTAEAEPLGVEIDLGDHKIEPRIIRYNTDPLEKIMELEVSFDEQSRMKSTIEAIKLLKNDEIPVIGNVSGHISTATSVVDPLDIFRMLRRDPAGVNQFFAFINTYLMEYAEKMIAAGADVIAISDPTATGEILGAKNFEKFAVPFYQELIDSIHRQGKTVLMHICGNARNIIEPLNNIKADAVSFDSMVNMAYAKPLLKTRLMGNVNTQLLHTGEPEKIISITRNALRSGVDIAAPACGLSMATPIANLKAMTDYVKRGNYN